MNVKEVTSNIVASPMGTPSFSSSRKLDQRGP
jgi:hypothetical protein